MRGVGAARVLLTQHIVSTVASGHCRLRAPSPSGISVTVCPRAHEQHCTCAVRASCLTQSACVRRGWSRSSGGSGFHASSQSALTWALLAHLLDLSIGFVTSDSRRARVSSIAYQLTKPDPHDCYFDPPSATSPSILI